MTYIPPPPPVIQCIERSISFLINISLYLYKKKLFFSHFTLRQNVTFDSLVFILVNPNRTCKNDEFRCDNGRCISKQWTCDGDSDCPNGDDEKKANCRKFIT